MKRRKWFYRPDMELWFLTMPPGEREYWMAVYEGLILAFNPHPYIIVKSYVA